MASRSCRPGREGFGIREDAREAGDKKGLEVILEARRGEGTEQLLPERALGIG